MSKSLKFKGTITMGLFIPNEQKAWRDYVSRYEGEEVWGSVAKFKPYKQRSNEQNRYYWGVIVKLLADEWGYQKHEHDLVHEILKFKFLQKATSKKVGERELSFYSIGSTATLSTGEFEALMSKIRSWASLDFKVYIPEPNEVPFEY